MAVKTSLSEWATLGALVVARQRQQWYQWQQQLQQQWAFCRNRSAIFAGIIFSNHKAQLFSELGQDL